MLERQLQWENVVVVEDHEQCSYWLLKTEEANISYDELKMLAQNRSRWCQ